MLYNEVNQLCVYIPPLPLGPPSHHLLCTLSGHHRALSWAPCPYHRFPPAISFTHGSVFMSHLISQHISSSPSPSACTCTFSVLASLFLPWNEVHLYYFSRFHIHALIYIYFSFSDLLHSVWQTLCPSTSLPVLLLFMIEWYSTIYT